MKEHGFGRPVVGTNFGQRPGLLRTQGSHFCRSLPLTEPTYFPVVKLEDVFLYQSFNYGIGSSGPLTQVTAAYVGLRPAVLDELEQHRRLLLAAADQIEGCRLGGLLLVGFRETHAFNRQRLIAVRKFLFRQQHVPVQ